MVWAVDTDKLRTVAGSKDEKLRRMIGGRFKRQLAQLDDMFDDGATYEALRQIINAVPEGAPGAVYRYAATVKAVHEAFENGKEPEMDGETASIFRCVRGWFREAAALGRGLVAYYH